MRTKWKHSKVLLKGGSNWEMSTNSSPYLDVRWSFKLNVRPCKENIRPGSLIECRAWMEALDIQSNIWQIENYFYYIFPASMSGHDSIPCLFDCL